MNGTDKTRTLSVAANPDCKVMTTKVDVMDAKQVDNWTASIIAEFGRLDGAANIAGGEKKGNRKAEDRITEIVRMAAPNVTEAIKTDGTSPLGR